ncbi:outer membrane protein [Paragemmobacter straminiformis]|uniref:Outer membrane beta-barrel protein n=1 Tax=Paragemmobacter straminiformis TaxID=2045119 RepID=A0A842I0K1_9RHOB|nr:outer membrane beta-barrel protein [Gemmobacter straminiformis]MBC2834122.1 outer membrane beta-barrel protein [Gemmobacter straminiformis]
MTTRLTQIAATAAATLLLSTSAHAGAPEQTAPETALAMPAAPRALSPFDGAWVGLSMGKGYSAVGVRAGVGLNDTELNILSLSYPDSGASGAVFGAEAGYGRSFGNGWYWGAQIDHLVTDLEANADLGIHIRNPGNVGPPAIDGDFGYSVRVKSMTSALGRIGYKINDSSMIYGLGGLTVGRIDASLVGINPANSMHSFVLPAVTLGLGIETMVAEKTSLKFEYRSTNFGSETLDYIDAGGGFPVNFHSSVSSRADSVRVVLVHRF